ncbi:uncharacterized protein [Eurosta solidaginis]|uniref:uncharacterized protein n=1 Tax=Eurosta solidaginis TaxID=178769 RepID=UPI003530FD7A
MTSILFITFSFIALLSQHSNGATPQRQRLTNLEYVFRYGTTLPIEEQQFSQINNAHNFLYDDADKFIKAQQDYSIKSNEIQTNTKDRGVYYNSQEQRAIEPRRPYWAPDYRKVHPNPATSARQSSLDHQASPLPLSTYASEIIYAPRAQYHNELQVPTLPSLFSDDPFSHNTQHKLHSNQKQYAPKRPPDVNIQHRTQLPYPPSFISITSTTSTTAPPLQSKQNTQSGQVSTSLTLVPDVFAGRHHKSLLDSYIPSWVSIRMLQQQKLLQTKQLRRIAATHTLAYPIMRKSA